MKNEEPNEQEHGGKSEADAPASEEKPKSIQTKKERTRPTYATVILSVILVLLLLPPVLLTGTVVVMMAVMDESDMTLEETGWEEVILDAGDELEMGKVVQITIEGEIGASASSLLSAPALTTEDVLSQLEQARNDEWTKAVVLRVNTPGGSVVASNEIYQKIMQLKKEGIKVVVSMGDTAASGGYYIAAGADRIYANPYTITGSLGVIMTLPKYSAVAEKIGYEEQIIKSGNMKDLGNPMRDMTEDEQAVLHAIIQESYNGFVDVIVKGRGLDEQTVRKLADGRIYTGEQAQKLGLIDGLTDLEGATKAAKKLTDAPGAMVVTYEGSAFAWEEMLMGMTQKAQDPLGAKEWLNQPSAKLEYRWK